MNANEKINSIRQYINQQWDHEILPVLQEYIKIPNKSPAFDPQWEAHGYMDKAMDLLVDWCKKQPIKNMKLEVLRLPKRTPLLFIEIPGQVDQTVLLYGHMDKQPEMRGWDADLGPWKPVIKDDKLYGRGGADDGYSVFSALNAIAALQRESIPHGRCVVIIEGSEESGSSDLPVYLEHLLERIGQPNLIICLDSSGLNYEQLWGTTSLRGNLLAQLNISVLKQGIHSGLGSGSVPSCFSILRELLDRVEDSKTGEIILDALKVAIPNHCLSQAQQTASSLGPDFLQNYRFHKNTRPLTNNMADLLINRSWKSYLSVTGIDGLPTLENAGNVTIPSLSVMLSFRLPPTCHAEKASAALKEIFEKNPPFNASISVEIKGADSGWSAPAPSEWLLKACDNASQQFFGNPAAYFGEGGTIPFMGMLGKIFPQAQFFITGVLGPQSNAHGPNEFLHIPAVKKITGCVALVLADHASTSYV